MGQHDPELVNRTIKLGNGAELPLNRLLLDRQSNWLPDQLKYGNQNIVRLDFRGMEAIQIQLAQWVSLQYKTHEKFLVTPPADRVRRTCSVLRQHDGTMGLPCMPFIADQKTLEHRSKALLTKIFQEVDPETVPDNRNGYGFIMNFDRAVRLLRKTATNRIEGCHIFIVKPNISLVTHAILQQNPASLTMIEPTLEFRDSLETTAALHEADRTDEKTRTLFEKSVKFMEYRRRNIPESQEISTDKSFNDCPIYFCGETSSDFFGRDTSYFDQILQNPDIETNDSWHAPPPKAQIILANSGGMNMHPVWKELLRDVSNREGIFKFGRIPISVVMTAISLNKMTDMETQHAGEPKKWESKMRKKLAFIFENYYDVENCERIKRETYSTLHWEMSDPNMVVLVPKREPYVRCSLILFEGFLNNFWDNRFDFTMYGLIKTFWMRNEAGKNFNSGYFARHVCTMAGVSITAPCTKVDPEEFCLLVDIFMKKVPLGSMNVKHLLHLKAARNIKTHVQKRDLKDVLEQVKYPVDMRDELWRYYKPALENFEDTVKPEPGMYGLPTKSEQFEDDFELKINLNEKFGF